MSDDVHTVYTRRVKEGLCVVCGDIFQEGSYYVELKDSIEPPPFSRFHLVCFSRQNELTWLNNVTRLQTLAGQLLD